MSNEKIIWNYFKGQGLNDFGTAGLMGNLFAESGLNPKNLQQTYERSLGYTDDSYTNAVDLGIYDNFIKDSAGYGLAQWTYWTRKQALLAFAKSQDKSIGDLNMQLNFLMKELRESYSSVLNTLCTANSVLEASNVVLFKFERPKDQSEKVQKKRCAFGQKYYEQFATTTEKGDCGMKYSDNNPPIVCMQKNSTCYKGTKHMTIRGVLWHSTGANNPNLRRYVQPHETDGNYAEMIALLGKNSNKNDWNHISVQAGLNAWIGKLADGSVASVQTMPWDYKPWGCGGGCNNGWIQFEICEDGLNDKTYFDKIYREACELTAYLCKKYGLDPMGTVSYSGKAVPVILCHADSYRLGLGSNHGDVLHWFPKFGKSMDDVRRDVAAIIGKNSQTPIENVNYQGTVTAKGGLNCRTQASTVGSVVTTYPYGTVVNISKEQNGWGYTGLGWVSLQYIKKIATQTQTKPSVMEDDDMNVNRFKELWYEMRKEFQDNDAGAWSKEARDWAVNSGLIAGTGTLPTGEQNYAWADVLTREQMAMLLFRFAQMMGKI